MNLPDSLRIATQITLVSLASYWTGIHFTGLFHNDSAIIGGLWSTISGIVVLQATQRDTWSSAWLRILGTFIGAVISAAYLSFLPFSPLGMAAAVFVTVLLCHGARIPDHARLASITVAVIMIAASMSPTLNPLQNAGLRFIESCIGTTMAVLAILIWPQPKATAKTNET
jgi:uncharacterized membrane protein YccC